MMTAFPVIDLAQTGRSIERHRRDAGLTVRDLQTYFGFEYPQAIYKWQHGECLPTVDNLLALARLLQVPMEDLLVYDDQEVSPVFGDISLFQEYEGFQFKQPPVFKELAHPAFDFVFRRQVQGMSSGDRLNGRSVNAVSRADGADADFPALLRVVQ